MQHKNDLFVFALFLLEGRVGLGKGELHSDQEDQGGTNQNACMNLAGKYDSEIWTNINQLIW